MDKIYTDSFPIEVFNTMAKEDPCLEFLKSDSFTFERLNQQMIQGLLDVFSLAPHTPEKHVQAAVQKEIEEINRELGQELQKNKEDSLIREDILFLMKQVQEEPFQFPKKEIDQLLLKLPDQSLFSDVTDSLRYSLNKYQKLQHRLKWMMRPFTSLETQKLDSQIDCEAIYHSISYEFRGEMKFFSILYEIKAVIIASANSFLLTTQELTHSAVKRLTDTILLVANILEWGLESYRGQVCIHKINSVHQQYAIPKEGFRFILSGIMFLPEDWNQRLGWRPFTEVEKLGWFYAILKVGKAMNIPELEDNYEEMKSWYLKYCLENSKPSEIKRRLFDQIIEQFLSLYPQNFRPFFKATLLAGMDDIFRKATGYPDLPESTLKMVRSAFFYVGHLSACLPRTPWFRTLQSHFIYPQGYQVEELGVQGRSKHIPQASSKEDLPEISMKERDEKNTKENLWISIDSEVYDLTQFYKNHPGGEDILLRYAGKDASLAFHEVNHSQEAKTYMKNFRIGRLKTSSQCPFSSSLGLDLEKPNI